jgi:hypothetical protein
MPSVSCLTSKLYDKIIKMDCIVMDTLKVCTFLFGKNLVS